MFRRFLWGLLLPAFLIPSGSMPLNEKGVLVVTAHAEDYLIGGGGTLASLIDKGYTVTVVQVTNDEKNSSELGPAETRQANTEEGEQAAKLLGAREVINLGHKSGELGYMSSTELRNEIFGLIRYFRPLIIFIPDPYIHYDENRDHFYVGKMAEEGWGYSSGSTFNPDMARMGLRGYSVPEIYFYAVRRPYRPGEGGQGNASFRPVDITSTFERKVKAILALKTTNQLYATLTYRRLSQAGRPSRLLSRPDEASTNALVRAYLEELAQTVGKKHGFRYGEEFNYVNMSGGRGLPEHLRERAVPAR